VSRRSCQADLAEQTSAAVVHHSSIDRVAVYLCLPLNHVRPGFL
jgi:hypothetical protein